MSSLYLMFRILIQERLLQLGQEACTQNLIIGYVTSGRYSLSIGRGQGIGSVSLNNYVNLKEQCHRWVSHSRISHTSKLNLVHEVSEDQRHYH